METIGREDSGPGLLRADFGLLTGPKPKETEVETVRMDDTV